MVKAKNPIAGIKAYINAFPNPKSSIGLLVKVMNISNNNQDWHEVREIIKDRPDIKVINAMLSHQETLSILASVDALISLHRSEGFGRIIAEAMFLNKPVVVSNFSGNLEFCNSENSYLVEGDIIALSEGDYIFHEGQTWFEPRIDDASIKIKNLYYQPDLRLKISNEGRAEIQKKYSKRNVVDFILKKLKTI